MKIGIITFHRALNYGAVLQAYALHKFLLDEKIDNQIIDYRSSYIEDFYIPIKPSSIIQPKKFVKELIYAYKNISKRKKFEEFIKKYINTTEKIKKCKIKDLNAKFDIYIAGSDQVWNYKWSGFDKTYFLDFAPSQKKYSYAASFGVDEIPSELVEEYRKLLKDFIKISVREASGKNIIKKLIKKEACISIDPTCLLSKQQWDYIAVKPKEEGYILLYTLEKSEILERLAQRIAESKNLKIIKIVDSIKKQKNFECRGFMSPDEFVGFFANAKYILTNSFHGLMFSCIYEKEFYLAFQEKEGAPNSRLRDFIKENNLCDRVVSFDGFELYKKIDYTRVKEQIIQSQKNSKKYIREICGVIV